MARRDAVIWAAGFFDGEGCISVSRQEKHRSIYFWLGITVFQKIREPLDELVELFGGTVRASKGGWVWRPCGPTAGAALEEMLPHLRVKRAQAERAIEFQGRRLATGKSRPASYTTDQDERDYMAIKHLKVVA